MRKIRDKSLLHRHVRALHMSSEPMQMKSTMIYILRANTVLEKGSLEKIWLQFPVVYNFSCQL